MFAKLINKISAYGEHHQAVFALIVTISLICISWGIEKILEEYIFPKRPFYGYLIAIFFGVSMLWIIKHYILHEI